MWYMPFLRVRRAVILYACFAIGLTLVAIAFRFWPGVHAQMMHGPARASLPQFDIDISMLIAASAAIVGGFATVLGLNLAAENEGHLELAWTKPVSREGYALSVFAVDIAAMCACILATVMCAAIVIDVYSGSQVISIVPGEKLGESLAFCGFPLSVYAWITALTASLKRNRGTIAGLFWPSIIALSALGLIGIPAVHAVACIINSINPAVIYGLGSSHPQHSIWQFLWGWAVAALLLAASVLQWRRLEV